MLIRYESEMRAVTERIVEAERKTRQMIGTIKGREEKYTEVLRTNLEQQLNGFTDGRVSWKIVTYTTDKSGQETRVGADLVVAVEIELDGFKQSKSFLVQAKVNKNIRYGIAVDGISALRSQCSIMKSHTNEAYVFAYGEQSTKVLKAMNVLTGAPLSKLSNKSITEFFGEVMMCWAGDPELVAHDHRALEELVKGMEASAGVLLIGEGGKRTRKRRD